MRTIFRRILNLTAWVICCISGGSFADSTKSPESIAFYNISMAIRYYAESHNGVLPRSWNDLIESGHLSGDILAGAKKLLDIENRYGFVDFDKLVDFSGQQERIIVMAIGPGKEGDFTRSSGEVLPGRRLVVRTSTGLIEGRRYHESYLERNFEKAGIKLSDYTGRDGRWIGNLPAISNEPDPKIDSESDSIRTSPPTSEIHQNLDGSDFEDNKTLPIEEAEQSSQAIWLIIVSAVIILLATIVGWLFRKRS